MNVTADNVVSAIYFDACALNMSALENARNWKISDTVSFPLTASVVAIRVFNVGSVGGLLASSDYFVTDRRWKVSDACEDGWMDVDFDDSLWQNASIRMTNSEKSNNSISSISNMAAWINSRDVNATDIFYRYRLKRPF